MVRVELLLASFCVICTSLPSAASDDSTLCAGVDCYYGQDAHLIPGDVGRCDSGYYCQCKKDAAVADLQRCWSVSFLQTKLNPITQRCQLWFPRCADWVSNGNDTNNSTEYPTVRPSPPSGPTPQPEPSPSPRPTGRPEPPPPPRPTGRPEPPPSPRPTGRPEPPPSPRPTGRPEPPPSPRPTGRPEPPPSPRPTGRPEPPPSPRPTGRPEPPPSPRPTGRPEPPPSPRPTGRPEPPPSPSGSPPVPPSTASSVTSEAPVFKSCADVDCSSDRRYVLLDDLRKCELGYYCDCGAAGSRAVESRCAFVPYVGERRLNPQSQRCEYSFSCAKYLA